MHVRTGSRTGRSENENPKEPVLHWRKNHRRRRFLVPVAANLAAVRCAVAVARRRLAGWRDEGVAVAADGHGAALARLAGEQRRADQRAPREGGDLYLPCGDDLLERGLDLLIGDGGAVGRSGAVAAGGCGVRRGVHPSIEINAVMQAPKYEYIIIPN